MSVSYQLWMTYTMTEALLNSAMETLIISAKKRIPDEKERYQFYQDTLKHFANLGWEGQLDVSGDIDPLYDDAVCVIHPELADQIEEDRARRLVEEEEAAEAEMYGDEE